MGKYRIKIDEAGLWCVEFQESKKSFREYFNASVWNGIEKYILVFAIFLEWSVMLCFSNEWKGLGWWRETDPTLGVKESIITYWYKSEEIVMDIVEKHKIQELKRKGKFEKVLYEIK